MGNKKAYLIPLIMAASVSMTGCGSITSLAGVIGGDPSESEVRSYTPQKIDVSRFIDRDGAEVVDGGSSVAVTPSNIKAEPAGNSVQSVSSIQENGASSAGKDMAYFEGKLSSISAPSDHVRMAVSSTGDMDVSMALELIDGGNFMMDMDTPDGSQDLVVTGGSVYFACSVGGSQKVLSSPYDGSDMSVSSIAYMVQDIPSSLASLSSVSEDEGMYVLSGELADPADPSSTFPGKIYVDKDTDCLRRIQYDMDGTHYAINVKSIDSLSKQPSDFEGAEAVSAENLSEAFRTAFLGDNMV